MSNPFSNGSSVADLQRPAQRYHEPTAQQAPDAYTRQVYSNQAREEETNRRLAEQEQRTQRGRQLAGFVQRDRRAFGEGFVWERIRPALWPERMPAVTAEQVEQAIADERNARAALAGAVTAYQLWAQQHQHANDDQRRRQYDDLTLDPVTAAQQADQRLDQALAQAAQVVDAIERWAELDQAAPGRRAAADKAHERALAAIETDVLAARTAAQRLGVTV